MNAGRFLACAFALLLPVMVSGQDLSRQRPPLPPGVKAEKDIPYVENAGPRQTLDVYMPEKSDGPRPCVVWIHGGGWVSGNKDRAPTVPLVSRGYVAASINYRLSQQAKFPAQIEDCREAIRFLRKNADKYGIDPNRIGVWGASAGGHLVSLLGTDPAEGAEVQAVLNWFGPSDLTSIFEQAGREETPRELSNPVVSLLGGIPGVKKELATAASPALHATSDDPPFMILHGIDDRLVPIAQSEQLAKALETAGVEVTLIQIPQAGHGGPQFTTRDMNRRQLAFFDKHLKTRATTQQASAPRALNGETR